MSEEALPARAIYGWDNVNHVWVKILVDSNGKIQITNADLSTILSEIQNPTYGLSALKDLIEAKVVEVFEEIDTEHSQTNGMIQAVLDTIQALNDLSLDDIEASTVLAKEATLGNATYGLSALKTLLDARALEATLTAIKGSGWSTETLKAIKDAIDAIEAALPPDPADESSLETAITAAHSATETKIERKVTHMDFWADNVAQVTLTTTTTSDYALNSLVIAGLPSGMTLVRVVALLKIAVIRDTSGSDNAVNGATALKVDADPAYGSLVTAIDIADNSWAVDVSNGQDRGGDILIGDNDVKAEIIGNGTFYARLENIGCDGNNLKLEDVSWGVRIYFY